MALARLTLLKSADFLNISGSTYDSELKALLISATAQVSQYCARTFESTAYTTERYIGNGQNYLYLLQWPVTTLTSVAIWDGDSTWDTETATYYTLRDSMWIEYPAVGYDSSSLYSCWPAGRDIRISYTAGYTTTNWDTALITAAALGTVPCDLEYAVLALAALQYRRRGGSGVQTETMGPRTITWATEYGAQGGLPNEIAAMLAPYRRLRL